ncbi:hypothetical protein [Roseateles sp.]|jgi:hypothetical protein|uniref:hypothetical protein n=1 Tax=Roseateles sp. TaxID=1971397 RepID=UPI0031D91718
MTTITANQRLLRTALASSNRMSDEMKSLGPLDLERLIAIQIQQQKEVTVMKSSVQQHRLAERKILNEQR